MTECAHENIAIVTRRGFRGSTSKVECEDCGVDFVARETVGDTPVLSGWTPLKDLMGAAGMGHRYESVKDMPMGESIGAIIVPTIRKLTVDAAKANKCSPCRDNFEHPFRGEVHVHPDGVFYLPFEANDLVDLDALVDGAGNG